MARKFNIEEIINDWKEARQMGTWLSEMSKEAFLGYATAMTVSQNPSCPLSGKEVFELLGKQIAE